MRARLGILIAGAVALGGCAYGYGGYGSPYSGVSIGVGYGSGYGGYGGCYDPYYGNYGYGSGYGGYGYNYGSYGSCGYGAYGGNPYYGWYGDYYYPGTGNYVYDSYRRPHVWSDSQRRYWSQRRERVLTTTKSTSDKKPVLSENWSGFNKRDRSGNRTDNDTTRQRRSDDARPR